MRTSPSQFQLLVDYMQKNGDLSRPSEGPHGRATNLRRWTELTKILNADATGDTKTVEKWRKVWSDLKNNTKKKSARIYRAAKGTGGGPACSIKLSDLEQRVLNIIDTRAATGNEEILEVGLEEEVTALTVVPTHHQIVLTDDSPSIFTLHAQLAEQTCSDVEDWNRPGTSAQPPVFPPLPVANNNNQNLVGRAETEIVNSPDRIETNLTHGDEPAAQLPRRSPEAGSRHHVPQSPTPLPLTPRRRRRRPTQNDPSPVHRRTRTQTQSDLARQAFVRSDCEWRRFQQESERERIRLRELELTMQERWLNLFGQFLVLGNRIIDILEKK